MALAPIVFIDVPPGTTPPAGARAIDADWLNNDLQPAIIALEASRALSALDYTTGGVVDLAALTADMLTTHKAAYFPAGTYTPLAYNIDLDTDDDQHTWMFFGDGHKTKIVLPSGMGSSDFLFKANSTSDAALLSHPHLIFRNFMINGFNAPNGSFLWKYGRSLHAEGLYFFSLLNGIVSQGYSDTDRLIEIMGQGMTPGGWMYDREGNGDGVVIENFFAYACAGIKMSAARPVKIDGLDGGWHQFTECIAEINCHVEGDGGTYPNDLFTLNGGWYSFSGVIFATPWRNCITIDDSGLPRRKTFLDLGPDFSFVQRVDAPGSAHDAAKCIDLHIANLSKSGRVRIHGARSQLFGQVAATGSTSAPRYEQLIPRITSDDSTITSALTARPAMLGNDVELVYRNANWSVAATGPLAGIRVTRQAASQVFLQAGAAAANGYATDMVAGTTKYYVCDMIDAEGRISAASTEVSATTSSGSPVIQLDFNLYLFPCIARIHRGSSSGTYTEYANVPIATATPELFDQGTYIAGQAWATSPPAVSAANTTQDGFSISGNGRAVIWANAAPTTGTWAQGDMCFNNTDATGSPLGWVCTVAGAPGTWSLMPPPLVKTATATLVAGTVTISDASITANSEIALYRRNLGGSGTPGALYISAKAVGTSFTVSSTSNTDVGSFRYEIRQY